MAIGTPYTHVVMCTVTCVSIIDPRVSNAERTPFWPSPALPRCRRSWRVRRVLMMEVRRSWRAGAAGRAEMSPRSRSTIVVSPISTLDTWGCWQLAAGPHTDGTQHARNTHARVGRRERTPERWPVIPPLPTNKQSVPDSRSFVRAP